MRRALRRSLKRFARPATVWCSAVLYLLLVSGIPLPLPSFGVAAIEKDRSQPFPCMDSKCGCRTAEQCWKSCCCHSLKERAAWAKANGVEPPSYVKAELAAEVEAEEGVACTAKKSSCCAPEQVVATCCEGTDKLARGTVKPSDHNDSVVLIQALACQGVDTNWLGIATAIPLPTTEPTVELHASDWVRVVLFRCEPAPPSLPAVPPPQCSIA